MNLLRSRRLWKGIAAILALALTIVAVVSVWWLSRHAVAVHRLTRGVGDTMFYGADGRAWFRLDEQRHDVRLADMAPDFLHAVVAIEDRRFYRHPGIDPIGIARAAYHDVREGAAVEGGSTLTTSGIVVTPRATCAAADARSGRMPSSWAACTTLARSMSCRISRRIGGEMRNIS